MHRAIMLFISASTDDHEEGFANLLHHYKCSRKFLRRQKSSAVNRKIVTCYIILSRFWLKSGLEGYGTQNIAICLRFRK